MKPTFHQALTFAAKAHGDQRRRGGAPYIIHPIRVSLSLNEEKLKVIAILHDTVEDTSTTLEDIDEVFGSEISEALDCLSHRENEPYKDYIERVASNELSRQVKLADIADNLADCPSDKAVARSAEALIRLLK